MTITTFLDPWEQESSTGASEATSTSTDMLQSTTTARGTSTSTNMLQSTTTARGVKVVGNFVESVWFKVVIGVIVMVFLIVLTFVLYKTCKKEGGKYDVQKWIQQQTNPFYY